ncbi:MAG: hypothetical protein ACRYGA_07830 [Janthinobacterium lividum]
MESKKQMGGARPGAGRKPQVAGAPAIASVTIKLSLEQKDKLRELGGAQWVRDALDNFKMTAAWKKRRDALNKAIEEADKAKRLKPNE